MTRKQLLEIEKRPWHKTLHGVRAVCVIPSKRKHDSGWACMDFVAEMQDGSLVGFGGTCDDVLFDGKNFRMDCCPESRCIHIWNRYTFSVSEDVSSITFMEQEGKDEQ